MAVPMVLAVALIAPLVQAEPAAAASGKLGVYAGAGNPAGVDAFGARLGRPVEYASDLLDMNRGWDAIANPIWLLDNWAGWVKAAPNRRLVLAVPMLPTSAWGQLAQGASDAFDLNFYWLAYNMVNRGLGNSVIRLGWEAGHYDFPWSASGDPGSYQTFFASIVDQMRAVPGANFTFDWTASNAAGGSPLQTFASFYPGDRWVDVIGMDQYDLMWKDSTSSPEQRWNFILNDRMGLAEHRAFANSRGKPESFPEWGLYRRGDDHGGGGDSPYFIDRMADWFASGNTLYQSYFDVDWGGGKLSDFPNGQARYRARFRA